MDNFRTKQPPVKPVSAITGVPVENRVLKNGISLFMIDAGSEDVARIEFVFKAGMARETIPLLAGTTNMMLAEGTLNYTAEELNSTLDFYGIFQNLSADRDSASLNMLFLNRHIEKAMELAGEILFRPFFHEKELSLMMKKRLAGYRISREKVQNIASDSFFESVFGSNHPYGRPVKEKDFEAITPALVRDFHSEYYTPRNMAAIISGKIHEDTPHLFEKHFGSFSDSKLPAGNSLNIINVSDAGKIHIEKPEAVQTAIRIGSATINKRHPDYPGLKILNTILGGYFGSRLMKNIREDKGYTYGIHSSVTSLDQSGYKVISTETGKQYCTSAINEIYREISILQKEPVKNDELEVVRNYMSGEMVRMFDGPFAIADSFKAVWEFGLDFSYFNRMMETVKTIGPEEIMRLANLYYNIDDLHEITAG